jgi:hypothetical protein
MGVLRAVTFAPYLLSLPVGVLVDRTGRRPLLIGVDLLRALLLGSIPLAAVLGVLAMPQLYVVAALSGALTLVFGVAYTAYRRAKREGVVAESLEPSCLIWAELSQIVAQNDVTVRLERPHSTGEVDDVLDRGGVGDQVVVFEVLLE